MLRSGGERGSSAKVEAARLASAAWQADIQYVWDTGAIVAFLKPDDKDSGAVRSAVTRHPRALTSGCIPSQAIILEAEQVLALRFSQGGMMRRLAVSRASKLLDRFQEDIAICPLEVLSDYQDLRVQMERATKRMTLRHWTAW